MGTWRWPLVTGSLSERGAVGRDPARPPERELVADGGREPDEDGQETDDESAGLDRSDVEVAEAGESEPAEPKWEEPNLDELPDFELGAGHPPAAGERRDDPNDRTEEPTAGRPNVARSPGTTRVGEEGTEGYVAALELCARLPEDLHLPEESPDLVPAAVEAELEQAVGTFAAAEFDNPSPHVETLSFVEVDDEVWLRLRLGVPAEAFADLDPDEVRAHALQELDGLL